MSNTHPATTWAQQMQFDSIQVDCTTAVVLKILDNKCKMLPGEMAAVLCIYDVVRQYPGRLFDDEAHRVIARARSGNDSRTQEPIHALRLYAEANIPKPVMKSYKALLREGLFGEGISRNPLCTTGM